MHKKTATSKKSIRIVKTQPAQPNLPQGTEAAAAMFRPLRALRLIKDARSIPRCRDASATSAVANFAASALRDAGLADAKVEESQVEGLTSTGGWLLPLVSSDTLPIVTATLGRGEPSVYLCAHLDESGAHDNASGLGVAIEALRTLASVPAKPGFLPPVRAIRVFLSSEVRGVQAWMNRPGRPPNLLTGLNLDLPGAALPADANRLVLGQGFPGQLHFSHRLLDAAARLADAQAGPMDTIVQRRAVSDAFFGLPREPGHVSIEQPHSSTCPVSTDTPQTLSLRSIQWSGVAAVAFLYAATRFTNRDALRFARNIVVRARREARRRPSGAVSIVAAARDELDSLRPTMTGAEIFGSWATASEVYRAGVSRRSGLWPAVADKLKLDALADALAAIPKSRTRTTIPARESRDRRRAAAMAPEVSFRGFLSFEDHVLPEQEAALAKALGLAPAWGTETWVWTLAARLRGKATLADTVDRLRDRGVDIDMGKAVALAEYLVSIGKARLRPVLGPAELRAAFRAVGVKRGSTICVHASLSQFGYVPGGSETLVDAVLDVLGPRGTMCMPTHSLSILGTAPYDPARSPSACGAVTEYFWKRPGVLRSLHPTHSVAAIGPAARALTDLPRTDLAPLSREGFWGKFYDAGGEVLLLCPLRSTTIFHVGEAWTDVPQPPLIVHALDARRKRHVFTIPKAPWHVDHFESTMAAPLLRRGAMRAATLGDGTIYLGSARAMADISVAVNLANPLVSLGRNGACSCFYCRAVRSGIESRGSNTPRPGKS